MPAATSLCVSPCPRALVLRKKHETAQTAGSDASAGIGRRRGAAGIVPFGHVGARADLHPAVGDAVANRQQPRRRAGLDARPDVILVAVAVVLAPHRRRQPEMRAPAAVAGALLAEQRLRRPARDRASAGQYHVSSNDLFGRCDCQRRGGWNTISTVLFMFASMGAACQRSDQRFLPRLPDRAAAGRRCVARPAAARGCSAIPSSASCISRISTATPSMRRSRSATIRS